MLVITPPRVPINTPRSPIVKPDMPSSSRIIVDD
tara:strand:+ start:1573 stop:1674 length:102 start_codon:yes stop_codon:yes gene_type:complete